MKIINKIYLFGLMAIIAVMGGCSEDKLIQPDPSPLTPEGCIGVYFPSTNTSVFELEPTDATEIELTIARTVTAGAADVPVKVEVNTENVFVVPANISFAAGEEEKTFKVTFPSAGEGTKYSLKVSVEGDQYVDPYSKYLPYVSTSVTRIAWTTVEDPMVYIDGTFATVYGVGFFPMYVWAERAETSDVIKYRFKNAYKVPTGDYDGDEYEPIEDEDGIFDGYPYNEPGDFDEDNDYITLIEIDKKTNEVFMEKHDLGVIWSYGMVSIGSIYRNISNNKENYPLGTLVDDKITFGENSLFFSMATFNNGGKYPADNPTIIYLSKDSYIADNLRISDFNEVEYTDIEGAVTELQSAAYSDSWEVFFAEAVDMDPENEDSDYKNLFYIGNAYAEGYGVAFYNVDGKITIPADQPIGRKVYGKEVFVSPSEDIKSSVETNAKGVDVYSLGLLFHYKDGTKLGDFSEIFFYSEDAVSYDKEDFIGSFNMTGESQFGDGPIEMEVEIEEGETDNELVIIGIDWAEEIIATFDSENSTMSIAPQELADVERSNGAIWDMTLYTTDIEGDVSTSAEMIFTFNMQGNLVLTSDTEADGYLIRSETAGGWIDGFADLVFAPVKSSAKSALRSASATTAKVAVKTAIAKKAEKPEHNFSIQGKISHKAIRNEISKISF